MIAYLNAKFDELNQQCFAGELVRPEIKLNTRLMALGLTRTKIWRDPDGKERKDLWIEISSRWNLSEEELTHVLLHEMIHYYIAFHDLKDDRSHGKLFVKIMEELNQKYGYHLSVRYAATDEELIAFRTHERHVCVLWFNSGDCGILVVAKNRMREIDKAARGLPDIKKIRWYISDREIFGRYPVAIRLRWSPIEEDKLKAYLTGAREEKDLFESHPKESLSLETTEMIEGMAGSMAEVFCSKLGDLYPMKMLLQENEDGADWTCHFE